MGFKYSRFFVNRNFIKKNKVVIYLFILLIFFSLSFTSAAANLDSLHVNIQTTDGGGKVITGTFDFVFNISTSNTCTPVVYSDSASLATDSRGIISHYLSNVNLDYLNQYYLCYYRDGSLIEVSEIARSPYSFRSKYVDLGGVEVTQNFDLGVYNMSATNFFGDGSGLLNLDVSNIDLSSYYTSAQISEFGYYNSTDFLISDYYLVSNPNNYLNDTTLNLSSINYWSKSVNDIYYNSGNVGIGTVIPQNKFNVIGDGNFTGNVYSNGLQVLTSFSEIDPYWTANQSSYSTKVVADTLYYGINNPNNYYNSTTLPAAAAEIDPYWTANFSLYNNSWTSTYNSTYNSWAYNQTIPAMAYADANFIKNTGDNATGEYNFDGGWTSGGASIIGGNLYAQALYVYDINSLQISNLDINGSMIPAPGFDNQFDIGSSSLRWRDAYFGRNMNISGDTVMSGKVTIGNSEISTLSNGDVNVW